MKQLQQNYISKTNEWIAKDKAILFDLEYRGIQDFITEMEEGFFVPLCFVDRIKRIVGREYAITLVETGNKTEVKEGCFCSMDYKDSSIKLKSYVKGERNETND